mmetsp:Transcript_7817/g.19143  ORF Transcript_7817/g.19143 Transcript_7817/m.19143 type:complete len:811 (-) Transcript_7817:102-2534(-)
MHFFFRLKSFQLLALAIVLAMVCDAHYNSRNVGRSLPLAGIFGFNGDRNKDKQQPPPPPPPQQQQYRGQPPPRPPPGRAFVRPPPKGFAHPPPKQQQSQSRRPPPPPPPPRAVESLEEKVAKELAASKDEVEEATSESTKAEDGVDKIEESTVDVPTNATVSEETVERPSLSMEPPKQQQQETKQQQQQWESPPQQGYDGWQGQQQQYQDYPAYNPEFDQYEANLYYLQEELTDSLNRESSLVAQLDNLTASAGAMEQREELHKHQLDVLTERVVDVEARAAEERNLLVEYEANCTALGSTILEMQGDMEEWQERCNEWAKKYEEDQEKLAELKQAVKEKQSEAEDLAIAMEELRMTEQRRKQYTTQKGTKSNGGLFSWMLSLFGFGGSKKSHRFDEDIRDDAFEMAKSTLLRALQAERNNVHELESAVASLQQNNSAISEMVESRDNIIDELNNRIAVFEEDKVVLKAALRQLQKEMKEEEPKTQKLIDDLAEAEQEIDKVKADFQSIIETHQEELVNLMAAMSQKEKSITDAESNLTAIGTYVDKLEDRLTSFAMTRRDMEDREKKCKEIERKAEESESKRKSAESELEELKTQEDELKKLLEELAVDRTSLQKENRRLYTEQEFRIGEQEKLSEQYEGLQTESSKMREELADYKEKCEALLPDLQAAKECQLELEQQVESMSGAQKQLNTLQIENAVVVEANEKLQEEINVTTEDKKHLEARIEELSREIEERKEAERQAQQSKKRRPPPPPPRQPEPNDVPLRSLRKTLSKATGIHGILTPSSSSKKPNVMAYAGREGPKPEEDEM